MKNWTRKIRITMACLVLAAWKSHSAGQITRRSRTIERRPKADRESVKSRQ
jgi:hypothetical protein